MYQYVACDPACAPSCRNSAKSDNAYQLRDKSDIVRRGFKRIERLGYRVTIEAEQHYFRPNDELGGEALPANFATRAIRELSIRPHWSQLDGNWPFSSFGSGFVLAVSSLIARF